MKLKTLLSLLLLTAGLSTMAQKAAVQVQGILKRKPATVKLFKVSEGKTIEIASSTPEKEGKFGFLFYPEYEGLYLIGTGNTLTAVDNYKFYFKGGEKLSIALTDSTYQLTGKENSKENVVLSQWFNLTQPLYSRAVNFTRINSTYVDYFPRQEEVVAKSKTFLSGKSTGNTRFDKTIKDIMQMDLAMYATAFLFTPRTAHPADEELSSFYSSIKADDFGTKASKVYQYPWGYRTLNSVIQLNMRQDGKKYKSGLEGTDIFLSYVKNDTLKGDVVLEQASRYKGYTDYEELMKKYGSLMLTESQKQRDKDIMYSLVSYAPGSKAFNFSYPDTEGKKVSLADLKGKVVLVDVWATWCGPCKKEIPALQQLEEEMKGKDVEFVSISVDVEKDKEKWMKMVKDEKLGGTQLFASGWSDITKHYKINAIPRFLVFDKEGKIVTVDSPRPSDPKLKALLEKTLAN
ncbi:TlpA family protein disulfide reductase [Desertivirga arenae]|uniref:TlpA family protein disulfide reductase n=1 Tax=Desertivirga arenae TaxID=2810309 RepID=UPI001A96AE7D|nr:TlpA disulfide reductase family protein [Pedobacter sp. SYSU D00823]